MLKEVWRERSLSAYCVAGNARRNAGGSECRAIVAARTRVANRCGARVVRRGSMFRVSAVAATPACMRTPYPVSHDLCYVCPRRASNSGRATVPPAGRQTPARMRRLPRVRAGRCVCRVPSVRCQRLPVPPERPEGVCRLFPSGTEARGPARKRVRTGRVSPCACRRARAAAAGGVLYAGAPQRLLRLMLERQRKCITTLFVERF